MNYLRDIIVRLLLIGCCGCQSTMPAPEDKTEPLSPVLIANGDGFLIHLLPQKLGIASELMEPAPSDNFGAPPSITVVTHTSTSTGRMRYLFVSGDRSWLRIGGVDRRYYRRARLLGLSVVDGFLYLLTWHDDREVLVMGQSSAPPKFGIARVELSVCDLTTGTKLASCTLKRERLPKDWVPDNCQHPDFGLLRIEDGKLTAFKHTLHFDGKQLHAEASGNFK